jgi:DNA-binding XRE family transcriptional regulator
VIIVTYHRWSDLKKKLPADKLAPIEAKAKADALEMTLRELREAAGKTQAEVADLTGVAQSELSRLERRDDHRLSTLRRYVEALGGELEVTALINGKRITLGGV